MPGIFLAPKPVSPDSLEVLRLRAELALYRQFEVRIRAEYAEPGAITKAEIRAVLAALDRGLEVLHH